MNSALMINQHQALLPDRAWAELVLNRLAYQVRGSTIFIVPERWSLDHPAPLWLVQRVTRC